MYRISLHLLILLAPNLYALWVGKLPLPEAALQIVVTLVFLVLLLAIPRRPWPILLISLPFYAAVPFELEYLRTFGELPSVIMVTAILETDPAEASELLGGFPLGVAFSVGLVAVNLWLAATIQFPKSWTRNGASRLVALAALVALISVMKAPLKHAFPYHVCHHIAKYVTESAKVRKYLDTTKGYSFEARERSGVEQQVHVLVIGESARAQNWGLYGYPVDTTPKLAKEPQLIAFSDATAIAPSTIIAIPGIITRARPSDYAALIHQERPVMDAFAEVGYRTWWISNQKRLGKHDTMVTAMASRTHEIVFVNRNYHSNMQNDGRLLEPVHEALLTNGDKKFIVVHLRGSHWNYSQRYPQEFNRFRPSLDPDIDYAINDSRMRTEIMNSYDNSILYTDHILSELIAMLKEHGGHATLTYVSDHGDNLQDDSRKLVGHGGKTKYDLRIPFVIWLSDPYVEEFPKVFETLRANREKRVSHDNIFFTLLDLARIDHRFTDPSETVSDPAFRERDRNFIVGELIPISTDSILRE